MRSPLSIRHYRNRGIEKYRSQRKKPNTTIKRSNQAKNKRNIFIHFNHIRYNSSYKYISFIHPFCYRFCIHHCLLSLSSIFSPISNNYFSTFEIDSFISYKIIFILFIWIIPFLALLPQLYIGDLIRQIEAFDTDQIHNIHNSLLFIGSVLLFLLSKLGILKYPIDLQMRHLQKGKTQILK